jgi:hypothetical protein
MIMKKFFILSALIGSFSAASAQDINGLWHQASKEVVFELGAPPMSSEHQSAYSVSEASLKALLTQAPTDPSKGIRIALPSPSGGYRTFKLWSTPMMEPALAAKYSGITTYTAELEGNPFVTAKIDYTLEGFHALVFDGANSYLINPYGNRPSGTYAVSYKRDITRSAGEIMSCGTGDNIAELPQGAKVAARTYGTTRKTYRLALSCTGEYAVAVNGPTPTRGGVLSRMVTTVNRVNGVYEREVAVSLVLIANNDQLIYLDGNLDPFNNSNANSLLSQNQTNTTTVIGSASYDIGHIFCTGDGGVAGLGVVCINNMKARGVTGRPNPYGDSFDIDYVAHEMGHQFGADHTFNASTGSCSGNGEPTRAFEPGSGSTIMAYAGLCPSNDVQGNSDDYFHSGSLEQISVYITSGNGANCPSTQASPNTNAVVPAFTATYVIPSGTPFELTAPLATDATRDTGIMYCWEQRDLGNFGGTLAGTTDQGPLFRSFAPDTSRTRVFPTPSRMLQGIFSYIGEKLPTVSRNMSFGLVERDMYQGYGTFNFPDDRITVQVEAMNPFRVTFPVGGEVWIGGNSQTITWDVSGTTAAPVSCANVDIYMSVDGGYSFPYLLKGSTPNDGSERVQIPNVPSDYVRIKVKGTNNVFFSVSSSETYIDRGTVSVGTTPAAESVTLSPVPAHGSLRVTVPQSLGTVDLQLLNMMGQTIWTGKSSGDKTLDASMWPRGVYQMSVSNDAGFLQTRKLVLE